MGRSNAWTHLLDLLIFLKFCLFWYGWGWVWCLGFDCGWAWQLSKLRLGLSVLPDMITGIFWDVVELSSSAFSLSIVTFLSNCGITEISCRVGEGVGMGDNISPPPSTSFPGRVQKICLMWELGMEAGYCWYCTWYCNCYCDRYCCWYCAWYNCNWRYYACYCTDAD